jgi:hypothetical protein
MSVKSFPKLRCPKCGAEADAACHCGVGYKIETAKLAIKKDPTKSDRAIASEHRLGKDTVRRARDQLAQDAPVEHVDERTGRDGRKRKVKKLTDDEVSRRRAADRFQFKYFGTVLKKSRQIEDLISDAPKHLGDDGLDERARELVEALEKSLKSAMECLQSAIDNCHRLLDQPVHSAAAANASRTNGNGAAN